MGLRLNGVEAQVDDVFEAYREMLCDLYQSELIFDEDAFNADIHATAIGNMLLHHGRYGGAIHSRTKSRLSNDYSNDVAIMYLLDGEYKVGVGDERLILRKGEAIILDRRKAVHLESTDNQMINLSIPLHEMETLGLDLSGCHGRRLDGDGAWLLRDFLQSLTRHGHVLENTPGPLLELASIALGGKGRALPAENSSSLKMRAAEYISANLDNESLGVDMLCRDIGTSRSALFRAFADDGGVSRFIRNQRLGEARRLLIEQPTRAISAIALDVGFSSHAHFTNLFRQYYGTSPRDLVASVRGESSADVISLPAARLSRWERIVGTVK